MAGKGGKREGAGRKPGSNSLAPLSRVRAKELIDTGCAPLDIMISNMMFFHNAAEGMKDRILELMSDLESLKVDGKLDEIPGGLDKLQQLVKNHLEARMNSQECAKDAAPYVHPRLTSIALKPPKKDADDVIIIEAALAAPMPDLNEDRSYREGYDNVTPLRRVMPGK